MQCCWLVSQELQELKKENFGLKLRIYHLEEALHVKNGTKDKGWQMVSLLDIRTYVCEFFLEVQSTRAQ